jgi:hypothetical protein
MIRNMMQSIRGFVFLAGLAAACGGASDVTGTYTADMAALVTAMQERLAKALQALPAEQRAGAENEWKQKIEKVKGGHYELVLNADGTWHEHQELDGPHLEREGRWMLAGSTLTLDQTKEEGKAKTSTRTATVDGNELRMSYGDGEPKLQLVLRKK